jgi:hypothetical protein
MYEWNVRGNPSFRDMNIAAHGKPDRNKYRLEPHPLDAEQRKRTMQAPDALKARRANPDKLFRAFGRAHDRRAALEASGRPAPHTPGSRLPDNAAGRERDKGLFQETGRLEAKQKWKRYQEKVDQDFVNGFVEWLRGKGTKEEYARSGWNPDIWDPSKPHNRHGRPISEHDSVRSYLVNHLARKNDYEKEIAEMKLMTGAVSDKWMNLDEAWRYYKYVVCNIPIDDDVDIGLHLEDDWKHKGKPREIEPTNMSMSDAAARHRAQFLRQRQELARQDEEHPDEEEEGEEEEEEEVYEEEEGEEEEESEGDEDDSHERRARYRAEHPEKIAPLDPSQEAAEIARADRDVEERRRAAGEIPPTQPEEKSEEPPAEQVRHASSRCASIPCSLSPSSQPPSPTPTSTSSVVPPSFPPSPPPPSKPAPWPEEFKVQRAPSRDLPPLKPGELPKAPSPSHRQGRLFAPLGRHPTPPRVDPPPERPVTPPSAPPPAAQGSHRDAAPVRVMPPVAAKPSPPEPEDLPASPPLSAEMEAIGHMYDSDKPAWEKLKSDPVRRSRAEQEVKERIRRNEQDIHALESGEKIAKNKTAVIDNRMEENSYWQTQVLPDLRRAGGSAPPPMEAAPAGGERAPTPPIPRVESAQRHGSQPPRVEAEEPAAASPPSPAPAAAPPPAAAKPPAPKVGGQPIAAKPAAAAPPPAPAEEPAGNAGVPPPEAAAPAPAPAPAPAAKPAGRSLLGDIGEALAQMGVPGFAAADAPAAAAPAPAPAPAAAPAAAPAPAPAPAAVPAPAAAAPAPVPAASPAAPAPADARDKFTFGLLAQNNKLFDEIREERQAAERRDKAAQEQNRLLAEQNRLLAERLAELARQPLAPPPVPKFAASHLYDTPSPPSSGTSDIPVIRSPHLPLDPGTLHPAKPAAPAAKPAPAAEEPSSEESSSEMDEETRELIKAMQAAAQRFADLAKPPAKPAAKPPEDPKRKAEADADADTSSDEEEPPKAKPAAKPAAKPPAASGVVPRKLAPKQPAAKPPAPKDAPPAAKPPATSGVVPRKQAAPKPKNQSVSERIVKSLGLSIDGKPAAKPPPAVTVVSQVPLSKPSQGQPAPVATVISQVPLTPSAPAPAPVIVVPPDLSGAKRPEPETPVSIIHSQPDPPPKKQTVPASDPQEAPPPVSALRNRRKYPGRRSSQRTAGLAPQGNIKTSYPGGHTYSTPIAEMPSSRTTLSQKSQEARKEKKRAASEPTEAAPSKSRASARGEPMEAAHPPPLGPPPKGYKRQYHANNDPYLVPDTPERPKKIARPATTPPRGKRPLPKEDKRETHEYKWLNVDGVDRWALVRKQPPPEEKPPSKKPPPKKKKE